MQSWQSADVAANGIRLHYTRTGGDGPPLVLAHGVTDDGLCWSPVAAALEPAYDVIMVDARGHGRSEAPEHDYDPMTQAADLAGLRPSKPPRHLRGSLAHPLPPLPAGKRGMSVAVWRLRLRRNRHAALSPLPAARGVSRRWGKTPAA